MALTRPSLLQRHPLEDGDLPRVAAVELEGPATLDDGLAQVPLGLRLPESPLEHGELFPPLGAQLEARLGILPVDLKFISFDGGAEGHPSVVDVDVPDAMAELVGNVGWNGLEVFAEGRQRT